MKAYQLLWEPRFAEFTPALPEWPAGLDTDVTVDYDDYDQLFLAATARGEAGEVGLTVFRDRDEVTVAADDEALWWRLEEDTDGVDSFLQALFQRIEERVGMANRDVLKLIGDDLAGLIDETKPVVVEVAGQAAREAQMEW